MNIEHGNFYYVKSVQVRSFFWSVFSRIRTEYGKIPTRKNFVFGHFTQYLHHCRYHQTEEWLEKVIFFLCKTARGFFRRNMNHSQELHPGFGEKLVNAAVAFSKIKVCLIRRQRIPTFVRNDHR